MPLGKSDEISVNIFTICEIYGKIFPRNLTFLSTVLFNAHLLCYNKTVQKIEYAETETRVYVKVDNQGSEKFSVYSFNTKLTQNGKQYEEQDNWDADYPEIQTDLLVGNSTEGIIAFPPITDGAFTLIFEGSSENWDEDLTPYTFNIEYHCFSVGENDSDFISTLLNGRNVESQLRKIVSSGARMDGLLNISYDEYVCIDLRMPSVPEQKKIAEFFNNLDNLNTWIGRFLLVKKELCANKDKAR